MKIVEQRVSAGDREIFDFVEFMSRPLFAHLLHTGDSGSCEPPVWFDWDGEAVWIIGGDTFPKNLRRDPRCALGIVDWDPAIGRLHHVGLRGRAEVLPFDAERARTILRRYFGPDESQWDRRFDDVFDGTLSLEIVRFVPETAVLRDQSYQVAERASELRYIKCPGCNSIVRANASSCPGCNRCPRCGSKRRADDANCDCGHPYDAERLVKLILKFGVPGPPATDIGS